MSAETENKASALEQMNRILAEKEALIEVKMDGLKKTRQELETFASQLKEKTNELHRDQEKLKQDKKDFEKQKRIEEEKIEARWREIQIFEENLQKSMEEVLAEKVRLESLSKEKLEMELKKNDTFDSSIADLDLDELRQFVGIDVPVIVNENDNEEADEEDHEEVIEAASANQSDAESMESEDGESVSEIPQLFLALEKEIEKSYSKWSKIELLPERYCLEINTRQSKEIRFFITDKGPQVDIVVPRKGARMDRKLQSDVVALSRIEPEWHILAEDNRIVCSLRFKEDTQVGMLLKKCSDFINAHVKNL